MTRSLPSLSLAVGPPGSPSPRRRRLAQTANCTWYAETALKQQQRNEQGKCGFTGSEWSLSKQAHLTWCATQTPDRWKAAAQKREQMLAGCKR